MNYPKVFVIDDDPTGTQTVHGVPVVTRWQPELLAAEFENDLPAVFVLANTRALPEPEAVARMTEIGAALRTASHGRPFRVISRSDSTLRGHFPAEVEALAAALGQPDAPIILCPYFGPGGRVTIDGVHYLKEGDRLTPVGETEFARDSTFGFRSSRLTDWVAEKSGGRLTASETLGEARVTVLSCASDDELAAVITTIRAAEATGQGFVFRTAASFASAYAGITPRPLLSPDELTLGTSGVLTVVGSYVARSTEQLEILRSLPDVTFIELNLPALFTDRGATIARTQLAVGAALAAGQDTVLFTSRAHLAAGDLTTGGQISRALVSIVGQLTTRPRALIAKGGITSSDLATEALGVQRALVLGQLQPGVPVWECGQETRWPGLSYVVFPGNVGGPNALRDAVAALRR